MRFVDKKKIGILIIVIIVVLGIIGALIPTEDEEELEQAEFEISNLNLSEEEVILGETVDVTVDVSNTGGVSKFRTVNLLVDGEFVDSQEVEVDGGDTETVTFEVSRDEAGTYDISVSDMTQTLEVVEP